MTKRATFRSDQIGEVFYHAYAVLIGGDVEGQDGKVIAVDGTEIEAGVFDLLSEAKKAAKAACTAANDRLFDERGSLLGGCFEWLVDARELSDVRSLFRSGDEWMPPRERWSSLAGHEGRECFAQGESDAD